MIEIANPKNLKRFNVISLLKSYGYGFEDMNALFNSIAKLYEASEMTIQHENATAKKEKRKPKNLEPYHNIVKFFEVLVDQGERMKKSLEENAHSKYDKYFNLVAFLEHKKIDVEKLMETFKLSLMGYTMRLSEETNEISIFELKMEMTALMGIMRLIELSKEEINGSIVLLSEK